MKHLIQSSWRAHLELESPGDFLRRERLAILAATATYVAIILTILFTVDAAFYYPRIETDQLQYLLKAKALAETGSLEAVTAVNLDPFHYAAMPGVLRAPFMALFADFDNQLRGIQLLNVAMVTLSALMGAYILSWALPKRAHKVGICFAFIFVLLSPDWLANTFVPMADAPYATFTLACLIIAVRTIASPKPIAQNKARIMAFVGLFSAAFMVRFTAPVLLVPAALLALGRWGGIELSKRQKRTAIAIPLGALAVLVLVNANIIFSRYILEPVFFLVEASKVGMALNLLASAVPAQIIPVFNIGFEVTPPTDRLNPVFGTTPRDLALVLAGLAISAVTLLGMIRSAKRFLPEIAYMLAILPVLTLMIPSTTRYLMAYQPVIWICFATGLGYLTAPVRGRISVRLARALTVGAVMLAVGGLVAIRSSRTARTASQADAASRLWQPLQYRKEVSGTYRELRRYVESLPADRALIITSSGETGRWYVIANRRHYHPRDTTFRLAAREHEMYSVLACGTPMSCQYFDQWQRMRIARLSAFGEFDHRKVFESRTGSARAAVYRITAAVDSTDVQSASGLTSR